MGAGRRGPAARRAAAAGFVLAALALAGASRAQDAAPATPQAAFALAQRLDLGDGMPSDPASAAVLYRQAAEAGVPLAQFNLGLFYDNGRGVPRDASAAAEWYRRAAQQGVARAQYNLGLLYQSGEGVPRDLNEARRWYAAAAARLPAARAKLALLSPPPPVVAPAPVPAATPAPAPAALAQVVADPGRVDVRLRRDPGQPPVLEVVRRVAGSGSSGAPSAKIAFEPAKVTYFFDLVRLAPEGWVRVWQRPIEAASFTIPLDAAAARYAWRVLEVDPTDRHVLHRDDWSYVSAAE